MLFDKIGRIVSGTQKLYLPASRNKKIDLRLWKDVLHFSLGDRGLGCQCT